MSCLNLARLASALGDLLCTSRPNWSSADVGVKATGRRLALAAAGLRRGSMTPFICTRGLPRLAGQRAGWPQCSYDERQSTTSAGSHGERHCEPADCVIWNVYFLNGSSVLSS